MNSERLTAYLDSVLDRDIPSFDCIVYRNHEMIYRHMGGRVDKEKDKSITGNEVYLMFSMTKVMTMCCIMQLVEQGRVSLEDPVSKFLPAYANLTYRAEIKAGQGAQQGDAAGQDGALSQKTETILPLEKPLLMKHLVSMQSGLDYDLNRAGIRRVLEEKGDVATTRDLVDAFVETPLDFVPGEHFKYSLSHDVVAAVIEAVSGMTFGAYMKKYLWEPLGLQHTFFAKPMNDDVPNLAQQFIVGPDGKIVPMEQSCCYQLTSCYESGGAGLISCTADYALLADAIACGGEAKSGARILKPETVETIKQNLLGEASRHDLEYSMGRRGYGYGCGMQVLMEPEKIGSSAPAGVFGWDGAAGACITMDTAQQLSVVYVQHVRNCGFSYGEIHPSIRDIVFSK